MMGWPDIENETVTKNDLDEDSLTQLIQRTTLDSSPNSFGLCSPSNGGLLSDNDEFGTTLDLNDEYITTDFTMFGGGQRKHVDYKLPYGDVKVYLGWGLSGDSLGDGGAYGSSVCRNFVSKRGGDSDAVFLSSPRKRQRIV
ncbi:unnamed protein product [Ambrosiozyma monospora]|uniref:Unnamed protein product n=1 Tax=Ambrosiozyma monospora TaxID=43982 RepID=A0ACB5TPR7_AMBMO|nr:unnamed protein product [Ambrosiozyma monospora]